MSSGVAMHMMWISRSSPNVSKSQFRMERMNLVAAMPLFATRMRRITRFPPDAATHFSYMTSGDSMLSPWPTGETTTARRDAQGRWQLYVDPRSKTKRHS